MLPARSGLQPFEFELAAAPRRWDSAPIDHYRRRSQMVIYQGLQLRRELPPPLSKVSAAAGVRRLAPQCLGPYMQIKSPFFHTNSLDTFFSFPLIPPSTQPPQATLSPADYTSLEYIYINIYSLLPPA